AESQLSGHQPGLRRDPRERDRDHRQRRPHAHLGAEPAGGRDWARRDSLVIPRRPPGGPRRSVPDPRRAVRGRHSDPSVSRPQRRLRRRRLPVAGSPLPPVPHPPPPPPAAPPPPRPPPPPPPPPPPHPPPPP